MSSDLTGDWRRDSLYAIAGLNHIYDRDLPEARLKNAYRFVHDFIAYYRFPHHEIDSDSVP